MVSIHNRLDDSGLADIARTGSAQIPTVHGTFTAHSYVDADGREHLAYLAGDIDRATDVLVRVHSECLTGDVLGSLRCDCGSQLDTAIERIATSPDGGVLVYLRGHEGRGIGLGQKLQAYALQDGGLDTVDANHALGHPADARSYDIAAAILADLGVGRVRLLTNNPSKSDGLSASGIDVTEQVPLIGTTTPENLRYLETKGRRMAHTLDLAPEIAGEETA